MAAQSGAFRTTARGAMGAAVAMGPLRPDSADSTSRAASLLLLVLALIVGAWLRFHDLAALELTADEAMSWYPAAAHSILEVARRGVAINAGRLSLHELMLHFWMMAFGDSLGAMRALSATLGVAAIALTFLVTRELLQIGPERDARDAAAVSSLSALIFALDLAVIHFSREARMYALVMTTTIAQVWFFLRAWRLGTIANHAALATLSFLAVATSLVNAPVLAAEYAWLACMIGRQPQARRSQAMGRAAMPAAALLAGALGAGLVVWMNQSGVYQVTHYSWQQANAVIATDLMAPLAFRSVLPPLTIGLAVWGTIRAWRDTPEAVWFALLWLWLPVIFLAVWLETSRALTAVILFSWFPIFLQRYVIACAAPFCILIAAGIWHLGANSLRVCAITVLAALAMGRTFVHYRSPSMDQWGLQWREAVAIAAPEFRAGRPVAVYPEYCGYVVAYYARNNMIVPPGNPNAHMLINAAEGDPNTATLHGLYPNEIAHVVGISISADSYLDSKAGGKSRSQ